MIKKVFTTEHRRNMSLGRIGWKDSEETKKRKSLAKLNNPVRYWKGKHRSEDTKQKLREKLKGRVHYRMTDEVRKKISESIKRQYVEGKREAKKGNLCHLWRGGVTPLRKKIRECIKYKQWRRSVFLRDNFTCILCSSTNCYLNVDHFPKQFSQIMNDNEIKTLEDAENCQEFWDMNNGRTLCLNCHLETEDYGVRIWDKN